MATARRLETPTVGSGDQLSDQQLRALEGSLLASGVRPQPLEQSVGVGTDIATGVGQNISQKRQITNSQTDQPLVKRIGKQALGLLSRGSTIGFGPVRGGVKKKKAGGAGSADAFRAGVSAVGPALLSALAVKPTPGIKTVINPRTGKPFTGKQVGTSVGGVTKEGVLTLIGKEPTRAEKITGGIRRKKDFNILNFEGIENIFSSAGELAAHFASPEFQAQRRKARVASATQKGRLTELKSIDSSIKALSSALPGAALSGDVELETTLSTQLSEMVKRRGEVSSGAGASRRGADPSTVEGFASLLKELGLTNEEIKVAANRRFAEGG